MQLQQQRAHVNNNNNTQQGPIDPPPTGTTSSNTTSCNSSSNNNNNTILLQGNKQGVCLIEVTYVEWSWLQPWQRCGQLFCTGSGFVITGSRILTNAHVVASAVDIRVRRHGSPQRFPARIAVYAPDVDLALLEIIEYNNSNNADGTKSSSKKNDNDISTSTTTTTTTTTNDTDHSSSSANTTRSSSNSNSSSNVLDFFGPHPDEDLALPLADELPELQERVHVVGFPTGGKTVCVTEGVVSRIDEIYLASPGDAMLAIQVDSAINGGNSGGPAFNSRGQVTGVAFCKSSLTGTDNVGYVIPAQVVKAFLGRCNAEDDTYTLSPSVPFFWHALENRSLRRAHQVPNDVHGILITDVAPLARSALQKGDVLTHIDGKAINDDGNVVLRRDELIQHRGYLLRGKGMNEETTFTVHRNGKAIVNSPPIVLRDIPLIFARWPDLDHLPDYLILGSLVLLPFTHNLMTKAKACTDLLNDYCTWGKLWPGEQWQGKDGLVVLTNILVHELSFSYKRPWRRVTTYNGVDIKSLRHLRDLWEETCKEQQKKKNKPSSSSSSSPSSSAFVRIGLAQDDDIVFEVQAAMDAQQEILEMHKIPCSSEIHPPNPKYKL